jgi:hypothetical protein
MILILRGHIRNAFTTPHLKEWVASVHKLCPALTIYIHTWSVFANTISWRPIQENTARVTKKTITDYFQELSPLIQHMMIEDDSQLPLIGNTIGKINNYMAPIKGWKNYWYGKYQILHYVQSRVLPDEMIINTRFDVMRIPFNPLTHDQMISFIQQHRETVFTKNKFMYEEQHAGIDNFYVGNIGTMYPLAHHFHYHLDDILEKHHLDVQENLEFLMNDELF